MHTFVTSHAGAEVRVHHNGDWSGLATVTWPEAEGRREVEIPAMVFVTGALHVVSTELPAVLPLVGAKLSSVAARLADAHEEYRGITVEIGAWSGLAVVGWDGQKAQVPASIFATGAARVLEYECEDELADVLRPTTQALSAAALERPG